MKQGNWGIEYHRVSDLTRDLLHTSYSVAKPVIGFLPGGLAVNYGPVYGQWTLIKSFRNPSSSDVILLVFNALYQKFSYAKDVRYIVRISVPHPIILLVFNALSQKISVIYYFLFFARA